MKTLTHNTLIRVATWGYPSFAKMGTVVGMAIESHASNVRWNRPYKNANEAECISEYVTRAETNGHELVFATYAGSALVNDPSGHYHRNLRAEYDTAVIIEDGEEVMVEGVVYRVKILPGQTTFPKYSDPIKFQKTS